MNKHPTLVMPNTFGELPCVNNTFSDIKRHVFHIKNNSPIIVVHNFETCKDKCNHIIKFESVFPCNSNFYEEKDYSYGPIYIKIEGLSESIPYNMGITNWHYDNGIEYGKFFVHRDEFRFFNNILKLHPTSDRFNMFIHDDNISRQDFILTIETKCDIRF